MRSVISRRCRWGLFAGCCAAAIAGCSGKVDSKPAAKKVAPVTLSVGEPVVHGSLTIFPVISSVRKDDDRFITLDEGLSAGTVQVCEVGSAAAQAVQPGDEAGTAAQAADVDDLFAESTGDETPFGESPSDEMPDDELPDANQPQVAVHAVANQAGEVVQEPAAIDDPFAEDNQRERPRRTRARVVFNAGANVNQLLVTNNSPRPLYLMPGEIFVGGQQDRTLAEELVVAPGAKNLPINVFCVEHGRWAARSTNQLAMVIPFPEGDSPDEANVEQLAAEASKGKFVQSGIALSKAARLTVQKDQDQQAVWDSVANVNASTGAQTDSQAFTANYAQGQTSGKIEPFIEALEAKVAGTDRVVGVIVAINGRIDVADVFESTPLFRKLWPKLLKSYALEASTAPAEQTCTLAEARAFLDKATAAQATATQRDDGRVITHAENEELASFSLHEATAMPAESPFDVKLDGDGDQPATARDVRGAMGGMGGGAMGGGFGGGVHSSAFSK